MKTESFIEGIKLCVIEDTVAITLQNLLVPPGRRPSSRATSAACCRLPNTYGDGAATSGSHIPSTRSGRATRARGGPDAIVPSSDLVRPRRVRLPRPRRRPLRARGRLVRRRFRALQHRPLVRRASSNNATNTATATPRRGGLSAAESGV